MAKTIASSSKPGAWIVNPNDKGRKSIKSGKVFLNDGDEFEIELFNPLTVSVLSDIKLNGQSISKTGLIVKPGQRIFLDCFIDDKRKFIFKTYEIDGSQESIDATQNNGLLEVFFYKEDLITLDNWRTRFDTFIVERWYPFYYPSHPYHRPSIWYGTSSPDYSIISNGGSCVIANGFSNTGSSLSSGTITTTALYSSNNTVNSSYTSGVDLSNTNIGGSLSSNMTPINSSLETGRIEKGESSKQKFTEIDMEFEKHYISSVIVQILPESRKPAEIDEVSKSKKIMEKLRSEDWKDITELIKKLADLHSAGILTDDEFSNKKSELLSKI
jgi:hypothetical protein